MPYRDAYIKSYDILLSDGYTHQQIINMIPSNKKNDKLIMFIPVYNYIIMRHKIKNNYFTADDGDNLSSFNHLLHNRHDLFLMLNEKQIQLVNISLMISYCIGKFNLINKKYLTAKNIGNAFGYIWLSCGNRLIDNICNMDDDFFTSDNLCILLTKIHEFILLCWRRQCMTELYDSLTSLTKLIKKIPIQSYTDEIIRLIVLIDKLSIKKNVTMKSTLPITLLEKYYYFDKYA